MGGCLGLFGMRSRAPSHTNLWSMPFSGKVAVCTAKNKWTAPNNTWTKCPSSTFEAPLEQSFYLVWMRPGWSISTGNRKETFEIQFCKTSQKHLNWSTGALSGEENTGGWAFVDHRGCGVTIVLCLVTLMSWITWYARQYSNRYSPHIFLLSNTGSGI